MKVLHIQKASGIGGSERHLLTLLPGLGSAGIETKMCVLTEGAGDDFVARLQSLGVETQAVTAGPNLNPRLLKALSRLGSAFPVDLIHTHLIHADLHGQVAARLRRVPAVTSMHSTVSLYSKQPYLSAARMAGRLAKQTIAISDHVARFLVKQRITVPDKITVIRYGLDLSGWSVAKEDRAKARERFGIAGNEVALGVASRLVPNKGHDFVIEAAKLAFDKAPNLRLLVAGDGELRSALEARVKQTFGRTERVRFMGFVPDITGFMSACDIMAFPSLPAFGEGFGLAALEAMASGRPLIASNTDSLPEIVEQDVTGFLVQPGDAPAMSERIVALANDEDLRRRMGGAARRRATDHFSANEMVQKTLKVYEKALA